MVRGWLVDFSQYESFLLKRTSTPLHVHLGLSIQDLFTKGFISRQDSSYVVNTLDPLPVFWSLFLVVLTGLRKPLHDCHGEGG